MNMTTLRLAIIASLLVVAGSFAAACGGDDGGGGDDDGGGGDALTLDAYFERVKTIMDRAEESGDAVETEIDERIGEATEVGEMLNALADGLDTFQGVAADVASDLGDIDPPSEVESQHRQLTAVFDVAASALDGLRSDVDEIDPDGAEEVILEQLTEFGTNVETEFGSLETQSEVLCFELQAIADENSIDIDLDCGD